MNPKNNKLDMIDLHCHSTYSDGLHTPHELLQKAQVAGLNLLALTDHDTIAGLSDLHQASEQSNYKITLINGIEFSIRWKKHELHILGLNISRACQPLQRLIKVQQERRIERGYEIARLLEQCGVEQAYQKAANLAGPATVSRPHFAKVLMNEGITRDFQSGFTRFLGRGKKAFVPTDWISIEEAIDGIVAANGHAVIAHPMKYSLTRMKLHELIERFKEAGGTGIEVVSGDAMDSQVRDVVDLCKRFDLLASTGSDFHGEGLSRVRLGRQRALPLDCKPIWNEWM